MDSLTLFWLEDGPIYHLPRRFVIDNYVKSNVLAMKPLDVIVLLLSFVQLKVVTNEGQGDNYLVLNLKKSQILISKFWRKSSKAYFCSKFLSYCSAILS